MQRAQPRCDVAGVELVDLIEGDAELPQSAQALHALFREHRPLLVHHEPEMSAGPQDREAECGSMLAGQRLQQPDYLGEIRPQVRKTVQTSDGHLGASQHSGAR